MHLVVFIIRTCHDARSSESLKHLISCNFMKIRPVEVELFHSDVQPDMTKLIAAFRFFVKATKNK